MRALPRVRSPHPPRPWRTSGAPERGPLAGTPRLAARRWRAPRAEAAAGTGPARSGHAEVRWRTSSSPHSYARLGPWGLRAGARSGVASPAQWPRQLLRIEDGPRHALDDLARGVLVG